MEQQSLLDYLARQPVARHSDPETSHLAATDAAMKASAGRLLVLVNLNRQSMTDFELADATGWQQTSIGKRRGECVAAGLVAASMDNCDTYTKRPTPSGSLARVWTITAAGRAFLASANG